MLDIAVTQLRLAVSSAPGRRFSARTNPQQPQPRQVISAAQNEVARNHGER